MRPPTGKNVFAVVGLTLAVAISLLGAVPAGQPAEAQELTAACPPGQVPSAGFPDVASGSVHAAAIDCLAWERHQVVAGRTDGTYGPAEPVRRDQMAGFVARVLTAAGVALPEDPAPRFSDTAGSVFARQIDQLAEAGVVRGRSLGRYAPGEPVTRAQMATFLVEAYWQATATTIRDVTSPFADIAGNTHEANISRAAAAGFTTGRTATTYEPQSLVRRDQMASFLARLLDRLLDEGVLGDPRTTSEGFVFVDGVYLPPPYTIRTTDQEISLNGQVIRSGPPPAAPAPVPDPPGDARDVIKIADALLAEVGLPTAFPPPPVIVDWLVDVLAAYPVTADVRVHNATLTVRDTQGGEASLLLVRPGPASSYDTTIGLQRAAARWADLLADGGVLLVTDGVSVAVPGGAAPGFLHDLVDVYDLPPEEQEAAMDAVVPPLAASLLAAGNPRDAIGARMPPPPPDPGEDPDDAGQTTATQTGSGTADSPETAALTHGTHRQNRTPKSRWAYVFAPFAAEAGCHTGPLNQAAELHDYFVVEYSGFSSSIRGLQGASGDAGILYVCAHGSQDGATAYQVFTNEAARDAELQDLQNDGIDGLAAADDDGGGHYYIAVTEQFLRGWQDANTIVFLDSCFGGATAGFYSAREVIAPRCGIKAQMHERLHQGFWGRLDGTVDDGTRREVRDAFDATFGTDAALEAMDAACEEWFENRIKPDWRRQLEDHGLSEEQVDDRMDRLERERRPTLHFCSDPEFQLTTQDDGKTVLSPGVAEVAPIGEVSVGSTVRGHVSFDAAILSLYHDRMVTVSGSCTRYPGLPISRWESPYRVSLEVEADFPGELVFTVHSWRTLSADNLLTQLDGNQNPADTSHVGPNRDDFVWKVDCVGVPEDEDPGTVPDDDEEDPGTVPDDGHVLTVRARSFSQGELPSDGMVIDPDKDSYEPGERVQITAPPQIGEHYFAQWDVDPPTVTYAASGNVISLNMDDHVTVTAMYEP